MANTTIMTVRIDRGLLAELKHLARSQGRSVSAQVVHVLRRQLPSAGKSGPTRRLAGVFAHLDVAEDVAEYRLGEWLDQVIDQRVRRRPGRRRR
jgi:hypothetical protein